MKHIQILMPMGGLGSRFSKVGYKTPKPLIEVDGKPMFMRALDSFKDISGAEHIFVLRQDQIDQYKLDEKIKALLPDARIAVLKKDTNGPVETCMLAKELISDDLPVIIADCDIYFESEDYFQKINLTNSDGILLTFKSNDPRYSYVKIDSNNRAIQTAEKVVISDNAILGGYYFSSGKKFKELSESFVSNPLPENIKEYYVSHLFNLLINEARKVEIASVSKMYIFGTPEELDEYNRKKDV